jgi:hypothetical protein
MIQNETLSRQLDGMDRDRFRRYRDMLDFYNGRQWQGREHRAERRLVFNYARAFVEKMTSFLVTGTSFAVDPAGDTPEDRMQARRAEAALQAVCRENNLEQLDLETETDCAVLGDGCYKVIWDTAGKRIRVTAPDVQGLYAWWAPGDLSRVWKVASRYRLDAVSVETEFGLTPRNAEAEIIEVWTERDFNLYIDGAEVVARRNDYGFIPFVIFPNLRDPKTFWGISDLVSVMESQRELNRAMSQLSRILELSGNPVAVLENVEASEDIAVRPGAVWNIPEDARAYLLDLLQGGGINLHIKYIDMLYRALHDLSESPRASFGALERDLSGVALEMELQPLLQKVARKRIIRTAAYNRRNAMILNLMTRFAGGDFGDYPERRLGVIWKPVLPKDVERRIDSEQSMVQAGIHSRRTAMTEIGVADPDAEFRRWLDERASILQMNRDYNARQARKSERDSSAAGTVETE